VPDLPTNMELVLLKGLAKDPAARFATAGQLASELRIVAGGRL